MPTIQVKDAGGTTIYLNVASGAGTSGDPYVLQDSIPTGTNSIGTIGLDTGSNAIGKLAAGSASVGTVGLDAGSNAIGSLTAGTAEIGKIAAGSAAIGSVSVSSGAITETNSGAIKTAVELIDNVVSGSEMQVDVVGALPTGSNAIGKLAAGSAAIGSVSIDSSQTVGLDAGSAAIGSLTAGTAAIGATKDNGPETAGTFTYTTSSDMTSVADIGPAPSGGQKSVLLQALISTDTAMKFTIQMETTAGSERQAWYLPASGSVIFVPRYPVKVGTADKKWQGIASVAGNVAISTVTTSEA